MTRRGLGLMFISALWLFPLVAQGASGNGDWLESRIDRAVSRIEGAKAQPAKVAAVRELERELDEKVKSLKGLKTDDARDLRYSLVSLRSYLDGIDLRGFSKEDCKGYRSSILLSVSPQGAMEYFPGEAKEALRILAALCSD